MKTKIISISLSCLLVPLILLACGPKETEPTVTTPPAGKDITAAPAEETGYEGLGLTEAEIKMLEERGVANVGSAEVASKIAGFTVSVPTYVPEDFAPGKFAVTISGAGLPPAMAPKFNNTKVQQVYTYQGDKDILFLLIQSPQQFSIGAGEPVEICGNPGERSYSQADPVSGQPYDRLTLSWEKDDVYYSLTGTLSGTLDKAELEKIACSIGAELEKIAY